MFCQGQQRVGKVRKTNVKRSARGASGKKPVAVTVQERKKKGGFKGSWFLPVLAEKSLPPFAVGKRMPCDGVGTIDYNISLPKTERLDLVCVRAFGHLMERSKLTQSWLRSNTAKLNKSPTEPRYSMAANSLGHGARSVQPSGFLFISCHDTRSRRQFLCLPHEAAIGCWRMFWWDYQSR